MYSINSLSIYRNTVHHLIHLRTSKKKNSTLILDSLTHLHILSLTETIKSIFNGLNSMYVLYLYHLFSIIPYMSLIINSSWNQVAFYLSLSLFSARAWCSLKKFKKQIFFFHTIFFFFEYSLDISIYLSSTYIDLRDLYFNSI